MTHRLANSFPLLDCVIALIVAMTLVSATSISSNASSTTVGSQQSWRVRVVSDVDLEGLPVVVPGTGEAFALRGNDGEEVATEPLERVDLATGHVAIGPQVPDDAEVGVAGGRIIVLAPKRYGADGVVSGPWSIWTVNPTTLQLESPIALSFVSGFGVTISFSEASPSSDGLWVSNGSALRLVDLSSGRVLRMARVPALSLSIDPTGSRLYVLTGAGGSTSAGSAYRAGTIVELDEHTGSVEASTEEWASSPQVELIASPSGVYVVAPGNERSPVVLLGEHNLTPVDLPGTVESMLAKALRREGDVTVSAVDHATVVASPGELTCIDKAAASAITSTALVPSSATWDVFAQRGATLFAWDAPSVSVASRIEAIAAPPAC